MTTQDAKQTEPEWARGLSEERRNAIRREAIRMGKTPTELVRLWILELSAKLNDSTRQDTTTAA